MKKPELKYLHLRSGDWPQHDVVSVGYRINTENGEVEVQIARCHFPDRWSRRIAHEICEGRMKEHGPFYSFSADILEHIDIQEVLSDLYHPETGSEFKGNLREASVQREV